jgi:hypothetical protein
MFDYREHACLLAISDAEGIQDYKAIGERAEEIARAARAYADAALRRFP